MFDFKQFIAVAVFIFIFVCDLYFKIAPQWYALLVCLIYLLFGVQPAKALAKILSVFKK